MTLHDGAEMASSIYDDFVLSTTTAEADDVDITAEAAAAAAMFWNVSYPEEEYRLSTEDEVLYFLVTFVAPSLFALLIVVGVSGNVLVIYVIVSNAHMRSVTNLLLLNLAVADIAFLLISVPFNAYKSVAVAWPFGNLVCQLVQFSLYVSAYVTIYTLVAVSALRYLVIVRSATAAAYCRDRRCAGAFVAALWLATMGLNVPTLLAHTTKTVYQYTYCGIIESAIGPLFVTFFVVGYALPLLIICVLYVLIVRYLRRVRHRSAHCYSASATAAPAASTFAETGDHLQPEVVAATTMAGAAATTTTTGAAVMLRTNERTARASRLIVLVGESV